MQPLSALRRMQSISLVRHLLYTEVKRDVSQRAFSF